MQSGRREDRLGLAPVAARATGWLRQKYGLFETASGCTDTGIPCHEHAALAALVDAPHHTPMTTVTTSSATHWHVRSMR